ncbi:hypothetical protein BV20DRAFT_920496, partial [Pilatotrama ljubarskyi]
SDSTSVIPRPSGSAGDGFNLRREMGLENKPRLYRSIQVSSCILPFHCTQRTIRSLVGNAGIDHRLVWRRQPKDVLGKLFRVARKRQPYLHRFVNDWATEELVKQYLKNRRAYYRRMHYDDDDAESATVGRAGAQLPHVDEVDMGEGAPDDENEQDE